MKNNKEKEMPLIPMTKDKLDVLGAIITDPFGSHTGVTGKPWETPVQDADDI